MMTTTQFVQKKILFRSVKANRDLQKKINDLQDLAGFKFVLESQAPYLSISNTILEGSAVTHVYDLLSLIVAAKKLGLTLDHPEGATLGYTTLWDEDNEITGILWLSMNEIKLIEVYSDGEMVKMSFTPSDLEHFDEIGLERCQMIDENDSS